MAKYNPEMTDKEEMEEGHDVQSLHEDQGSGDEDDPGAIPEFVIRHENDLEQSVDYMESLRKDDNTPLAPFEVKHPPATLSDVVQFFCHAQKSNLAYGDPKMGSCPFLPAQYSVVDFCCLPGILHIIPGQVPDSDALLTVVIVGHYSQ